MNICNAMNNEQHPDVTGAIFFSKVKKFNLLLRTYSSSILKEEYMQRRRLSSSFSNTSMNFYEECYV